jgi:hypothetical protein
VSSRRKAVPFDPYHYEKLRRSGTMLAPDATFRDIYDRHHWAGSESASGAGSAPDQTRVLRARLPGLLRDLGVRALLDLPCGDYSWMRSIELPVDSYIGADLLPELIHRLNAVCGGENRDFRVLDLTRDRLPEPDLLFCRDCLVHLSYADIRSAFRNFIRSGIPHLLTTTFPECGENEDIVTGDWRVLNLERPPFAFPRPLQLLNEGCSEAGGLFGDKSLGLWRTEDLAGLPFHAA